MQFDDIDVQAITDNVWQAILGLAIQPAPVSEPAAGTLVGRVAIVGAWQGTMVVECPEPLARHIGGIMFGLAADEVSPAHARDAMSEITNMIGGNLKALLPEPCQLLFPEVTDAATVPRLPGDRIARVGFECEAWPFAVSIYEEAIATDAPSVG
jgi:chemotaxis protein CheX